MSKFELRLNTNIYKEELALLQKYAQLVTVSPNPMPEMADKGWVDYKILDDTTRLMINEQTREIKYFSHRHYYSATEQSNVVINWDSSRRRWCFGEYNYGIKNSVEKILQEHFVETYLSQLNLDPKQLEVNHVSLDSHYIDDVLGQKVFAQIPFERWVKADLVIWARNVFGLTRREQQLTLDQYTYIWKHEEGIREIYEKIPALIHAIPLFKRQYKRPIENFMGDLRAWFLDYFKLSKGDWRTFCTLSAQQGKWLLRDGQTIGMATAMRMVKEGFKFPKVTAMQAIAILHSKHHELRAMRERSTTEITTYKLHPEWDPTLGKKNQVPQFIHTYEKNYDPTENLLDHLTFAALQAANESKNVRVWVKTEWEQIMDWFVAEGHSISPDANQLKPTRTIEIPDPANPGQKIKKQVGAWRWYVKHSEGWHERVAAQVEMTPEVLAKRWESELPEHEADGFRFVPLLCAEDLTVEGNVMKHCVGQSSYIDPCWESIKFIWSVRDLEGNRLATFELRRPYTYDNSLERNVPTVNADGSSPHWTYGQMRGKRNCDMDELLKGPCERLVTRWNETIRANWERDVAELKDAAKTAKAQLREQLKEAKAAMKKAVKSDTKKINEYNNLVRQKRIAPKPELEAPALRELIETLEIQLGLHKPEPQETPVAVPDLPAAVEPAMQEENHPHGAVA